MKINVKMTFDELIKFSKEIEGKFDTTLYKIDIIYPNIKLQMDLKEHYFWYDEPLVNKVIRIIAKGLYETHIICTEEDNERPKQSFIEALKLQTPDLF